MQSSGKPGGFTRGASPDPFCQIGRYRHRRPPNLAGKPVQLGLRLPGLPTIHDPRSSDMLGSTMGLEDHVNFHEQLLRSIESNLGKVTDDLAQLTQLMLRLTERHDQLAERHDQQVERHDQQVERLDRLEALFERWLRSQTNGRN